MALVFAQTGLLVGLFRIDIETEASRLGLDANRAFYSCGMWVLPTDDRIVALMALGEGALRAILQDCEIVAEADAPLERLAQALLDKIDVEVEVQKWK